MKKIKKPKLHRQPWTAADDRRMVSMTKKKSAAEIALALGRTASAVQQRLMNRGISLREAKR